MCEEGYSRIFIALSDFRDSINGTRLLHRTENFAAYRIHALVIHERKHYIGGLMVSHGENDETVRYIISL